MATTPINVARAVVAYLLTQPSVTGQVGIRIYAGSDLPETYVNPRTTGAAILVVNQPGVRSAGSGALVASGFNVLCYHATEAQAEDLNSLIVPILDGWATTNIRSCVNNERGRVVRNPFGWPLVASTYAVVTF